MPRYRSEDSDDDRDSSRKHKKKSKKRRGRSRSGSDSGGSQMSSSRVKKSKKKHGRSSRSPSPDRGQGRSSRRSRSSSLDRYYSGSRKSRRSYSRSRSPAPRKSRRSRSRSRSKGRRGRSRSYSRERRSRSDSRNRSARSSPGARSDTSSAMKRMNLTEPSSVASLTPAQQAEERMRLALKAAAAADQRLRQLPSSDLDPVSGGSATAQESSQPRFSSLEESQNFADSVAAIDSGKFKQKAFKSTTVNTGSAKSKESTPFDMGPTHDDAIFGSLAVTGFTIKPDPDTKPLDLNPESIIHPSLFVDPEDKMDRWIERLTRLRKRILEGDAL